MFSVLQSKSGLSKNLWIIVLHVAPRVDFILKESLH